MTYQNITIVHPGAKTIKEYYYYINNAVEINEDKIGQCEWTAITIQ